MSRIERDVAGLMPLPESWYGLLLGAVIGATGAALVVISQLVATRRLRRHFGPASTSARTFQPGPEGSPL